MTFKEASDAYLATSGTLLDLAECFAVARETVSRWRSKNPGRYRPPDDWAEILAGAAEEAAARRLADAEREAGYLAALAVRLRG